MDLLFLDANVLFSAAYRPGAGLRRLWDLASAELVSSAYAVEEARSNLRDADQRQRLAGLTARMYVIDESPDLPLPPGVQLPDKDRPILVAAIRSGATHLLTGDVAHFGQYFGQRVQGVLILRPGEYLRSRGATDPSA